MRVFKRWQTAVLLTCALSAGCANVSTLQTAKTLPEGEGRAFIGGGMTPFILTATGSSSMPYGELAYRRGFFSRFDAGAKLTLIGTTSIDAKYQLVDMGGFAVALGAGIGVLPMTISGQAVTLVDLMIPIYVSFDFTEWLAIYASPKYMLRAASSSSLSFSNIVGATGGIKVGKTWGLFLEASYVRQLGGSGTFTGAQFNGAIFYSLGGPYQPSSSPDSSSDSDS